MIFLLVLPPLLSLSLSLCICRPEVDKGSLPQLLFTCSFKIGSVAEHSYHHQLANSRDPSISAFSALGLQMCIALPEFYVVAGGQTQILMLLP